MRTESRHSAKAGAMRSKRTCSLFEAHLLAPDARTQRVVDRAFARAQQRQVCAGLGGLHSPRRPVRHQQRQVRTRSSPCDVTNVIRLTCREITLTFYSGVTTSNCNPRRSKSSKPDLVEDSDPRPNASSITAKRNASDRGDPTRILY